MDALNLTSQVLAAFPGVWFVTDSAGRVVAKSDNNATQGTGVWWPWSVDMDGGLVAHFAVKCFCGRSQ